MANTHQKETMIPPPKTIEELMTRVRAIEGQKLGALAQHLNLKLPSQLHHEKGTIGQLIEFILGAHAGSKPEPDFPHLGIELKTIPVNKKYWPQESTYICTTQVDSKITHWQDSTVYKKTHHVLWVPIIVPEDDLPENRVIGQCLLWQPSAQEQATLKADWEELMDMVYLGHIDQIKASYGEYLHIRPKAANSRVLFSTTNFEGTEIKAGPKGFYLRASFTRQILAEITQNSAASTTVAS